MTVKWRSRNCIFCCINIVLKIRLKPQLLQPMSEFLTDDGETKDYDKPEHFVQITLDADGNAKSNRATVKVEG